MAFFFEIKLEPNMNFKQRLPSIESSILKNGTITKQEMQHILGLTSTRALYKRFFNDDVLHELDLTDEQYLNLVQFDSIQTRYIINKFRLYTIIPALKLLLE
jgi:hypothetical protein